MSWIFKGCLWNTELENWFSWQNRSRLWEKTDLAEEWFSQKKWFQKKYKIPCNSNKYFWYFFSEKLILDLCNSDRFGWEIVLTWAGSWEAGRLEHKILINQIGYSMALHGPESEHKQAEKTDGAKMHCIGKGRRQGELGKKKKLCSELIFSFIWFCNLKVKLEVGEANVGLRKFYSIINVRNRLQLDHK